MLPIKTKLPEHFLDEEVRCDYKVSHEMKKLWAVEIDLLVELDRVCKENGITYWVNGGTMLGAARHKGFIPWDDDIDVMVPRRDYIKLCKIAPNKFSFPYFFQTEYTDPTSFRTHAQLRNSRTTAILSYDFKKRSTFNQGIFIDIFPLDNIPDNPKEFEVMKRTGSRQYKTASFFHSLYLHKKADSLKTRLGNIVRDCWHPIGKHFYKQLVQKHYKKYEDIIGLYANDKTKECSLLVFNFGSIHRRLWSDFDKTTYLDFEFIKVPVPYKYEDNLTRVFGDWHKFVKGTSFHGGMYFDTERPYTEVYKDFKEGRLDLYKYFK